MYKKAVSYNFKSYSKHVPIYTQEKQTERAMKNVEYHQSWDGGSPASPVHRSPMGDFQVMSRHSFTSTFS